jgi:hypothetical protein
MKEARCILFLLALSVQVDDNVVHLQGMASVKFVLDRSAIPSALFSKMAESGVHIQTPGQRDHHNHAFIPDSLPNGMPVVCSRDRNNTHSSLNTARYLPTLFLFAIQYRASRSSIVVLLVC